METAELVGFLQAVRPDLATALTWERLASMKRVLSLEARVRELEALLEESRRRFATAFTALRGETTGGE